MNFETRGFRKGGPLIWKRIPGILWASAFKPTDVLKFPYDLEDFWPRRRGELSQTTMRTWQYAPCLSHHGT